MARKYAVSIKYADGSGREFISAQPLERTCNMCKWEAGAVWFKVQPSTGWDENLVREYTFKDGRWVQ